MSPPAFRASDPYLPFDGGQWRLKMGLSAIAPAAWFELDGALAATLAEKRALMATRPAEIFASLPECVTAAHELLALVASHLPLHHPQLFARDGAMLANRTTGERWDVERPALHPLDLCGRLVQEDFCLMLPRGETHVLAGASLSAPNRWVLAQKLGRPLLAIHDVVPGYEETLARTVDRFLAEVRPDKLVARVNWGISDRPDRFLPVPLPPPAPITGANAGARLYLRIERQTLRKLAQSGAVVFTIRTYIERLDRALSHAAARDLAGAIRTMPPAMQRYKAIAPVAPALLEWLEARAATA
jgi:dimethylamine monooxygenase subunit A